MGERTKMKGGKSMKDEQIIELLEKRDESALRAAEEKYGGFCHTVASF